MEGDVSPRDPWSHDCQQEYENPNWGPLAEIAGNDRIREFMWMGRLRGEGWAVELYKHRLSRRYLNIDLNGNTFRYMGSKYVPIPRREALTRVFGPIRR